MCFQFLWYTYISDWFLKNIIIKNTVKSFRKCFYDFSTKLRGQSLTLEAAGIFLNDNIFYRRSESVVLLCWYFLWVIKEFLPFPCSIPDYPYRMFYSSSSLDSNQAWVKNMACFFPGMLEKKSWVLIVINLPFIHGILIYTHFTYITKCVFLSLFWLLSKLKWGQPFIRCSCLEAAFSV